MCFDITPGYFIIENEEDKDKCGDTLDPPNYNDCVLGNGNLFDNPGYVNVMCYPEGLQLNEKSLIVYDPIEKGRYYVNCIADWDKSLGNYWTCRKYDDLPECETVANSWCNTDDGNYRRIEAIPMSCDYTKPIRDGATQYTNNIDYKTCKTKCDSDPTCSGYVYTSISNWCRIYHQDTNNMKFGPYGPGLNYGSHGNYLWRGASSYIKLG